LEEIVPRCNLPARIRPIVGRHRRGQRARWIQPCRVRSLNSRSAVERLTHRDCCSSTSPISRFHRWTIRSFPPAYPRGVTKLLRTPPTSLAILTSSPLPPHRETVIMSHHSLKDRSSNSEERDAVEIKKALATSGASKEIAAPSAAGVSSCPPFRVNPSYMLQFSKSLRLLVTAWLQF